MNINILNKYAIKHQILFRSFRDYYLLKEKLKLIELYFSV